MSILRRIFSFSLVQLVIAFIALIVVVTILSFAVIFLNIPSFGRITDSTVSAVGAIIVLLFVGKLVERRSVKQLGFTRDEAVRDTLIGFLLGAALMGLTVLILFLAGWYKITSVNTANMAGILLQGFLLFVMVSIFEEILFRGIIFRLLEISLGSWIALILSAVLFGAAHLANPAATLLSTIAIAIEAGIMLGALYMLTRNLWAVIGLHLAWNFFQGTVFGIQVSGNRLPSIVQTSVTGPELLTGGAFGAEAGLIALTIGLIMGITILILAVRRNKVITPGWMRRRKVEQEQSTPVTH